jgi:hypothetical protein
MKLIVTIVAILNLLTNITFSEECDWKTIQEQEDDYIYSESCHREVGKLVKETELRKQQVEKLNKAIELKDLTIQKYDERVELWMQTSDKLEKKVTSWERWKEIHQWMYFGLGVVATGLSVYLAGKIYK